MTKSEAIEQIKWYFEMDDGTAADNVTKRAINMAIEALEGIPREGDCWSCNCPKMEQPRPIDPTVEVDLASGVVPRSALNQPKVTIHTDRPKGHWIWYEVRGQMLPYCSECGNGLDVIYEYNFCPDCGADMRGKSND